MPVSSQSIIKRLTSSAFSWQACLRFLVIFSPAWMLIALVAQHAVNIPVWDGWERAELLQKWDAGTVTFRDLYAPHIDHRMVFPRLISLFVASVADGDLRWEIAASWCFGFAAGLGIWVMALRTLGPTLWTGGLAFLANLWIFSPLQYDNWLWPIQTAFLLPMSCLIWALVATTQPNWHWAKRFALAAGLAIVGTHSFSHGLFIWPAVLCLMLMLPKSCPEASGKWSFLIAWVITAGVIIGCYFGADYTVATEYSYSQQRGEATPLMAYWKEAVAESGRMWEFFLGILGGPMVRQFSGDPLPPSKLAGLISLLAYTACGIWALWQAKTNPKNWARVLPWLALGGAVIAIALGASVGRSAILAGARASVPRFLSISLYLPFTYLAVVLLCWEKQRRSEKSPIWNRRLATGGTAILGGLIALQCQPWLYGARLMEIWHISRLQGQAHVMFIEHFEPEPSRILAYSYPEVKRYAPILNRLGYLDPPLVKTLALDQFTVSEKPLPVSKGLLESAERVTSDDFDGWLLKGLAIFREPSRPADVVLLTAESAESPGPMIVGTGAIDGTLLPTRYRIDLQFSAMWELLERDPGTWMRWRERLALNALPPERPLTIRALAFDMQKRKAYPLPQRLILKADGAGVLEKD